MKIPGRRGCRDFLCCPGFHPHSVGEDFQSSLNIASMKRQFFMDAPPCTATVGEGLDPPLLRLPKNHVIASQ